MIAASNSWVISFDNLSGIQQWLSDALCRLSTGGGFATRELHTDNEEILFDATRPIILNGIDDIAGNADLADWSVIVTLPQVAEEDRIPDKMFWRFLARAAEDYRRAAGRGKHGAPELRARQRTAVAADGRLRPVDLRCGASAAFRPGGV